MLNFKRCLWNSTENILPIHLKIQFLYNDENLRALRFTSSYTFLKRPLGNRTTTEQNKEKLHVYFMRYQVPLYYYFLYKCFKLSVHAMLATYIFHHCSYTFVKNDTQIYRSAIHYLTFLAVSILLRCTIPSTTVLLAIAWYPLLSLVIQLCAIFLQVCRWWFHPWAYTRNGLWW